MNLVIHEFASQYCFMQRNDIHVRTSIRPMRSELMEVVEMASSLLFSC